MGGSCWSYVAPYTGDVARALSDLQQRVFEARAYFDRRRQLEQALPRMEQLLAAMPPKDRTRMIADVKAKIAAPDPTTIDELREMNEDSGTHSILDMEGVSAKAKAFRVAPLSSAQLKMLFGTEMPDRGRAEAGVREIWELREGWSGAYVLIYDGKGVPTEILFAGCSGD